MWVNGYFQLLGHEDGTYLRVFPPKAGGQKLQIKEVMNYLTSHGILYDLKKLNDVVETATQETDVLLNLDPLKPERESYFLSVDQEHMKAIARFYAPSDGGELMTKEELLKDLSMRHITSGICEEAIADFFDERKYCTSIVVAQGTAPRMGTDARIEYFFQTDRKAKPAVHEDGSVDFHDLNAINHCNAGDVLARLIPADPGDSGVNIYGERIKPRDVKRMTLQFGKHIQLSEDRLTITSEVNGHVSLTGGRVFVSDVLHVENVDNATGDITYGGSVQVSGNVFTGFAVKAEGNIEVLGVVEGAVLEAGGNITIARGMNGMSRGSLSAKGHVVAKFLENATVSAGEYISTESILHCNINAGTEIEVTGRRGFITGGHVLATNKITTKTLGSDLGASTIVEVGSDPALKREIYTLQKKYADNQKNIRMIEPVLTATLQKKTHGALLTEDQMKNLQSLAQARQNAIRENGEIAIRLDELEEIVSGSENPMIIVTGTVYPGTKIAIKDSSMMVRDALSYCKFIRTDGEVKMTSI